MHQELSASVKAVLCYSCKKPMQIKRRERIPFAHGTVNVTYGCESCQYDMKRTVHEGLPIVKA
jgi:RNase P subunit RPR2